MRIRKHLLVGGATAAVALASVAAAVAGAQAIRVPSRRMAPARSRPSRRPLPNRMSASTAAPASSSASPARAAAERFCETDLSNASRPIRLSEAAQGATGGDRLHPVPGGERRHLAHGQPTEHLGELLDHRRAEADLGPPDSNVNNWSQVRQGFPNVPLRLFGPGADSGTFEFFTEKINGRARQSRSDYSASEDDNVLVRGVAGRRGPGCGGDVAREHFVSYLANKSRLKVVRVNSGDGCVTPSVASVQNHVQAALPGALRLREEEGLQARRRCGLHPAHDRQLQGDLPHREDRPAPQRRSSARRSGSTTPRSGTGRTTRRADRMMLVVQVAMLVSRQGRRERPYPCDTERTRTQPGTSIAASKPVIPSSPPRRM